MTAPTSITIESAADHLPLAVYRWPAPPDARGVVQISHGLAEYGLRYDRLAQALTSAGFAVVAHDHRGHGASVSDTVVHGGFGEAGWDALAADLVAVSTRLADEHPGLPLFLLGHSMGSFALQEAIVHHSPLYRGVVLSGSTALDVLAAGMADGPVGDLSAFNAGFEPRTGYEWLSRDEAEVDAYVADPLCGFDLEPDTVPRLFSGAARLAEPANLAHIRPDLPILLVSGTDDPLAGGGELIRLLGERYRNAGVTDVTIKLYPAARHEVFNETNRNEVTADVTGWLLAHA